MTEQVTLVLGEDRIEVCRDDLITKSEYFASLLSPNFRDSSNDEHRINYDIDAKTLRTFVKWASDSAASVIGDRRAPVKPSLSKYVGASADFHDLMQLLQMSVLFASEALIKDLTNLIVTHWLIPEKSIQIWQLANELSLTILRDLAKLACVDHLCNLPESSLLSLPGEEFVSLVGNLRVEAPPKYLQTLTEKWINQNVPPGENNPFENRYPFTMVGKTIWSWEMENEYRHQRLGHNMQCVVGYKRNEHNDNKLCVYCWDGKTFYEILELPSFATVFTNSLVGMQALGQGFDIYLVGGEYGENTRNFQTDIWRYSLISKTWYYVTTMPRPRRHMVAAFIKEELFLVGGLNDVRRGRSSVDVYNIFTGEWSRTLDVYEEFTSLSLKYEDHKSLMLYDNRIIAWYTTEKKKWEAHCGDFIGIEYDDNGDFVDDNFDYDIAPRFVWSHDSGVYVLDFSDVRPPRIWEVEDFEHFESHPIGECLTSFDNQVSNGPYVIGFTFEDGVLTVEMIKLTSYDTMETKIVYKEKRNDVLDLCFEDPIGCFNILNPNSLNQLFSLDDTAKRQ